jgi:1,4-dihydroxy-2-naphthoate octaprenyltransferase
MTGSARISNTRAWILAARPKTLSAAAAPVFVGTGLAAAHGTHRAAPAVAALVGALLIQIGTNLANDYYDFVRGGDTEDRVGPTRVTQAGMLHPKQVWWGMVLTLAMASMVGIYLVSVGGWPIVWVGLASLLCAVAYTGGPYPLAYHGLGDLFVFLFFGLVAVGGSYWVQALALPGDVLLAGVGVGALNTAILVANNVRDLETDAAAGKRTLAVRIGRPGSRIEYTFLMAVGFVAPILGVALYGWPPATLVALGAGLASIAPVTLILTRDDARELVPALPGTARVVALYGVLLGLSLAFG